MPVRWLYILQVTGNGWISLMVTQKCIFARILHLLPFELLLYSATNSESNLNVEDKDIKGVGK